MSVINTAAMRNTGKTAEMLPMMPSTPRISCDPTDWISQQGSRAIGKDSYEKQEHARHGDVLVDRLDVLRQRQ